MVGSYLLTPEVVFYPERGRYGYKLYARMLDEPFLFLVSPGIYAEAATALLAAGREIRSIETRMLARDARLRYVNTQTNGAA